MSFWASEVKCTVTNVERDDLDRWLANHATGRYIVTRVRNADCLKVEFNVDFELMKDRILLRESFDVVAMTFYGV